MSKILENSIWPNHNGELGEIKVQIPDGITTTWPEGDALVGNFVYKDGKLVGLVDTKALTENETKSTVMSYDFVDITLDKRLESLLQINRAENNKYLTINYEVQLPTGYKRLEYLEGDGQAYLNIPREWKESDSFRVEYISTLDSPNENVFGATNSYRIINVPKYTRFMVAGKYYDLPKAVKGEKNVASIDAQKIIFNGKEKAIEAAEWANDAASYKIFTNNTLQYRGKFRLLYFEHLSDTNLILIPALDTTGTPCMYDIISQEPFYNAGTGQFLYPGAESQVATSDLDETFYAKMTPHGIKRLYKVPSHVDMSKDEYAIENGFKQLVEPPMPEEEYWRSEWTETDTQIICNWIETEAPTEENT